MKETIVVFSGAGLSAESGIPTFRDSKTGLWENHKVEDVASQDGWQRDKKLVLDFYAQRMKNVLSCEPNEGHKALARLQEKYNVVNITQNIDNLLERAGCEQVWHLHGTTGERKCEWHKDITNLDGDTNFTCDYKEKHDKPVELGDLCPKCNAQLRPAVVWFGEAVDMKDDYLKMLQKEAQIFIGVGTSAQVHPAAGLIWTFKDVSEKYWVDPKPPLRLVSFTKLTGTAAQWLPKVADHLLGIRKLEI